MRKYNPKISKEVNDAVKNFLNDQLGESPRYVSSYLNNDFLTCYAHGIASPAEEHMLQEGFDNKLWSDYKNQQFESVEAEFSEILRKFFPEDIRKIYSTITDDGIRILHICFQTS